MSRKAMDTNSYNVTSWKFLSGIFGNDCICLYVLGRSRNSGGQDTRVGLIKEEKSITESLKIIVLRATWNLTKPTSEPRSGFYSERFDIYIACFRKLAPADAEKREKLESEKRHANRGRILAFQSPTFSEALSLPLPHVAFLPPSFTIEAPHKAPTFGAHFYSKSRKESIFRVVKCVATRGTSKFQIVMAAQLIRDRVEMECLEGAWETLEGNTRCRFRGTIRFTATSLVHPDEPARTLQRTVEWILPTPTPYRLVEPVQVIEVTSSEEDPEEDLEELPPEPAVDALDFLEGDEDPLLEVDSPEEVMSASEADSTEDSGPREMAISGGSSS
ncbi:hypothetical protein GmHk_20G057743 [Glycine max]|nr:hypothetical protein GmHk_20G057743 [Glycine max]